MFYLLDKPVGPSSFTFIKAFSRQVKVGKIGHTGTLDPLASGLILVATDDDTKLISYVDQGTKTYRATMILGVVSNTYDSDGTITATQVAVPPSSQVAQALNRFVGPITQYPPAFSARKINGKRAYTLARQGEPVQLEPSVVTIKSITAFTVIDASTFSFEVTVSRGTYIRSLIHDLGQMLGCGAIMSALRRTAIGELTVADVGKPLSAMRLVHLPPIAVQDLKSLLNGKVLPTMAKDGQYALTDGDDVVGIVVATQGRLKAARLFGHKLAKVRT